MDLDKKPMPNMPNEPQILTPGGDGDVMPPKMSKMMSGMGKNKWMKLIIIVVVLVALGGVAYLALRNTSNSTTQPTQVVKRDIPLLRVSVPDGPISTLYPDVDPNDGSVYVNVQIFEPLVAYNNVSQIVPILATSWTNPDSNTWIFTLRQGVTFHTGHTMTAADVKFSLDKYKDTVFGGEFGSTIKSVTVVDPYTVKITTTEPDPILLNRLTHLYVIDSKSSKKDNSINGTGPYMVKAGTKPTADSIDLVAYDGYHGGHVYTQEVQFTRIDSDKAVTAFNNQQIDIASSLLVADKLNLPNQRLQTYASTNVDFLGINSLKTGSPLAKLKVRQALYEAIDPSLVIQAQGVSGDPIDQLVNQDIPGFNPAIKRPAINISGAKQLLKDAGYPNGFTITLTYGSSANKGMFGSVKSQLAKIGVTVKEDFNVDTGAVFDKILAGQTDLFFLGYAPDLLDGSDSFSAILQQIGIYHSDKVDSLLKQANQTFDATQRLSLLQQVGQVANDDVATIPLYTRTETTALAGPYVAKRDLPVNESGFFFWKVYLP